MFKMKTTVESDFKQIDALLKRVGSLTSYEAEYGYFEGEIHESSGLDISDLAHVLNEDRPFMDMARDEVQRHFQVDTIWKHQVWQYLAGKGAVTHLLKDFGRIGESYIQSTIANNADSWPNVEWWAKAKFEKYQRSIPLIETGELFDSIKIKVRKIDGE